MFIDRCHALYALRCEPGNVFGVASPPRGRAARSFSRPYYDLTVLGTYFTELGAIDKLTSCVVHKFRLGPSSRTALCLLSKSWGQAARAVYIHYKKTSELIPKLGRARR